MCVGGKPVLWPFCARRARPAAARGIKKYERDHLNALAATFLPKLPSLPPEMVRRVVEYAFHVGDY